VRLLCLVGRWLVAVGHLQFRRRNSRVLWFAAGHGAGVCFQIAKDL
jgi:hypothetical protein